MKKAVLIGVVVGVGALAAGVVFGVMTIRRAQSLDEYRENLAKILQTRSAVEKFIDAKAEKTELTDEELKLWADFETAYVEIADKYAKVSASEFVKEQHEDLKKGFERIEKLYVAEQSLKVIADGELSDDDLATMKSSTNKKITDYAADLEKYRAKVKEFNVEYGKVDTAKNDAMKKRYDELVKMSDDLLAKYGEMSLEDILEMSRDDILGFYATIELLQKKD